MLEGLGAVHSSWLGGKRAWEDGGERGEEPNPLLPLQLKLEEKLASGSFFKTHLVGRVKIKSRVSVGLGFPLSLPRAGSGSLGLLQLFGRRLGG